MMAIELIPSHSLFCLARTIKLFWLFWRYSEIPKHFNSCCWMSNKAGALWLQFDNWADTGPTLFWSFSGSFYLLTITSAWVVVTVLTAWWDSNPCFLQWERDDVVCSAGPTLRWELANNICNDGPFANIQPSEWEHSLATICWDF